MKLFLLLTCSLLISRFAFCAGVSHDDARICYQDFLDTYIEEHDEGDNIFTFSSLEKEEILKMFSKCKVKDELVVAEMLKVAIASDFQAPINYDSSQSEELSVQQSTYSTLQAIYGRFSSESGVNINFPSFQEYQKSEINRNANVALEELRKNAEGTYYYLSGQNKILQKFSDQELEALLDSLLFRYGQAEACQSYCPLIYQELRKLLLSHPTALKHLSDNYIRNKYIWLNINNDYYTGEESIDSPFLEENTFEVKKKKRLSQIETNRLILDPRCDTEYLISSELYKIKQRSRYLFLITDKCGNKISLKNISNKLLSMKLEMMNPEGELQYSHIFTGKRQVDIVEMIRVVLKK